MAISVLANGNSGDITGTGSGNIAITFSAGNRQRKLLVGIVEESASAISSVVINGQDLVALGLLVPSSQSSPTTADRAVFYEQFDAGLPLTGSSNLVVTFGTTGGNKRVFWWLLDGCEQNALASGGASRATGAVTTTANTATSAGAAGSFMASVCYRDSTTGTLVMTTPASSTTVQVTGTSSRFSGGHKLGGFTPGGSQNCTWTHTSGNSRCMSVVIVDPGVAAGPNTFAAGSASASATANRRRSAGPNTFAAGSASASATVLRRRNMGPATFASGSASASATVNIAVERQVSLATFASGAASASATVGRRRVISVAVAQAGSASFSASVSRQRALTTAHFQAGPAGFSATARTIEFVVPGSGSQEIILKDRGRQTLSLAPGSMSTISAGGRQRITVQKL